MRSLFDEAGRERVIKRLRLKVRELTVKVDKQAPVWVSFQQMVDFAGGEGVVQ